jgi:hypothetical protein
MKKETNSTTNGHVDHGALQVVEPPRKARPFIPSALRSVAVYEVGIPLEEAARKYGVWTIRMLQSTRVFGHELETGDTCVVAGNLALDMAVSGNCEFLRDAKADEEQKLFERARALNLPEDVSKLAAFAGDRR